MNGPADLNSPPPSEGGGEFTRCPLTANRSRFRNAVIRAPWRRVIFAGTAADSVFLARGRPLKKSQKSLVTVGGIVTVLLMTVGCANGSTPTTPTTASSAASAIPTLAPTPTTAPPTTAPPTTPPPTSAPPPPPPPPPTAAPAAPPRPQSASQRLRRRLSRAATRSATRGPATSRGSTAVTRTTARPAWPATVRRSPARTTTAGAGSPPSPRRAGQPVRTARSRG